MIYRSILALFFVILSLSLSPVRANAQAYIGTGSSLSYGTYNGTSQLMMFSEWFYLNNGSGSYMWSAGAVHWDLTVTKYTSWTNHQSNNPVSVNTVGYTAGTGEWSIQQWNETTARLSGTKYVQLEQGYLFVLSIVPRAHGSYRPNFYAQYAGFDWNGEEKTITVDLLWPPDE